MRRPRTTRATLTAALLVTAVASFGYWAVEVRERQEAEAARYGQVVAAQAARTASTWSDSSLLKRWDGALVARGPLDEWFTTGLEESTVTRLRLGLVDVDAAIGNVSGRGVIDYATTSDQNVQTLGATGTLRAVTDGKASPCQSIEPCDPIRVVRATPTTMSAPTARGAATAPAWLFQIEGMPEPLVLPAVTVTSPDDIVPAAGASSWASLLARDGSTLTVRLTVPFCGEGYQRHLVETDTVIVVWATGAPNDVYCAVAVTRTETFTLRAPISDKPVVDHLGAVVLPDTSWRLDSPPARFR